MTCRQMDNMISSRSGNSPLSPEAAEHVAGCHRCHTLVRLLGENRETPSPSHKQLKRIQAAVIENISPVRPLPPARIFLFAFALIFLSVVMVGSIRLGVNGWGSAQNGAEDRDLRYPRCERGGIGPFHGSADGAGKQARCIPHYLADRYSSGPLTCDRRCVSSRNKNQRSL